MADDADLVTEREVREAERRNPRLRTEPPVETAADILRGGAEPRSRTVRAAFALQWEQAGWTVVREVGSNALIEWRGAGEPQTPRR